MDVKKDACLIYRSFIYWSFGDDAPRVLDGMDIQPWVYDFTIIKKGCTARDVLCLAGTTWKCWLIKHS